MHIAKFANHSAPACIGQNLDIVLNKEAMGKTIPVPQCVLQAIVKIGRHTHKLTGRTQDLAESPDSQTTKEVIDCTRRNSVHTAQMQCDREIQETLFQHLSLVEREAEKRQSSFGSS